MPLSAPVDITQRMLDRLPAQYKDRPRMEALVAAFGAELQEFADAQWLLYSLRNLANGPEQIVGRAVFTKSDSTTLYWPFPFKDTKYQILAGKAIVTDGGGPVEINVDNNTKTKTSVGLYSTSLFTGYVNVLAWNPGENPLARGVGGDLLDKLGKIVGQPRNGMVDTDYLVLITARIAANRSDGRRESLIRLAKLLVPGATVYIKDFPPCSVLVYPQAPIQVDPYVAAQFMEIAKSAGVLLMFEWTASPVASTITAGSIYASGFSAGPPATNTGVTSAQSPGSIYHSGFTSGPPCTNDGGGKMPGVIQSQGEQ